MTPDLLRLGRREQKGEDNKWDGEKKEKENLELFPAFNLPIIYTDYK